MTVNPQAAPPADAAQPAPLPAFVPCSDCKQAIRTYYFALNEERPVCARCKAEYAKRIERGSGPGAFARVLLNGGGAAAGLALVLGGLIMAMGFLRIFAAVAVGYLIGRVIQWTTGHFYDRRYQVVAVVLTWLTIGTATLLPVIVEAVRYVPPPAAAPVAEPQDGHAASADSENPWASTDSLVAEIDAHNGRLPVPQEKTPAQQLREGNAVSRVANTLLLIALLPVLGLLAYGVQAAGIGILALGFGVYKAWDITGQGVAHELSGPHRVGTGPIPQTR